VPDQTGSAQIHAQARPDLCWQAAGNGSPVTLENCGSAEGQQWTLTGNGVLMNGNGYCLQAGPTLLVGFSGQCDGGPGQQWTYHGATGQLAGDGTETCAVLGGPLAPGTPVTDGACASGTVWSLGSGVIPVPAVSSKAGPAKAEPPRAAVHTATATAPPVTAAASPGGAGYSGLPLAALLTGLLLVAGATLVFFGRRSRSRGHPAPGQAGRQAADDTGPYVVDVTAEVARRRARGLVDTRPTEPLDVTSLLEPSRPGGSH
jgi:hypothetical protein